MKTASTILTAIASVLFESLLPIAQLFIAIKLIAVGACLAATFTTWKASSNYFNAAEKEHFKDHQPDIFESIAFGFNHLLDAIWSWYKKGWRNEVQLEAGAILFGVIVCLTLIAIFPSISPVPGAGEVLSTILNTLSQATSLDSIGLLIFLPMVALTIYDVFCRIIKAIWPIEPDSNNKTTPIEDGSENKNTLKNINLNNDTQNFAIYQSVTSAKFSSSDKKWEEDRNLNKIRFRELYEGLGIRQSK